MSGEFTLDTAEDKSALTITRVTGSTGTRHRMLQMGFTPGTQLKVLRHGPLDDPVEIVMRGAKLALRREEARNIAVKKTESK